MNILTTLPLSVQHRKRLVDIIPTAIVTFTTPIDVTESMVQSADIILGNVPPAYIDKTSNLKWIQLNSAGTNGYCDTGVLHSSTILTNSTGAYGLAISEYMIGVTFALKKNLHHYVKNQHKQLWQFAGNVSAIRGSTTLVIGLGDIGGEYAKRMKALGSYIIGVKRRASTKPDYIDELYYEEDVDILLPRADIVALAIPGNSNTDNYITKQRFKLMKSSAILLNVGRGTLLDTDILYQALSEKWIAGAGIDVVTPEPLPPENPLWLLDNIIITPHVSGGYSLSETFENIVDIAFDNLTRFINGELLKNIVDFKTGYKIT